MKKTTKNDVYLQSNNIYAQNGTLVMVSSFVIWITIFILMLFPIFGFGLSFFAMCFFSIGYKKIILDLLNDKTPKIENIFDYFKDSISAFCLKVASTVIVLLWSILFIIPGIIMGLNFAFAPYILAENRKIGAIRAMQQSKKMIYGNRGNVFVLYLTMALCVVLIALIFSLLFIILNMLVVLPLWLNILSPSVLTIFIFFVFVLPYFEIVFATMYNTVKRQKEQTKASNSTKKQKDLQIIT